MARRSTAPVPLANWPIMNDSTAAVSEVSRDMVSPSRLRSWTWLGWARTWLNTLVRSPTRNFWEIQVER